MRRALMIAAMIVLAGCGGAVDGNLGTGAQTPTEPSLKRAAKGGGRSTGTSGTTSTSALNTTGGAMTSTATWQTSYPIVSTNAIHFATDFSFRHSDPGHHQETLFVLLPDGNTYERFDVAFATDVTAGPGEQQAQALGKGSYRVWVSLPVAGTAIEDYAMTGNWGSTAYLDGSGNTYANTSFALQ